MSSRSRAFRREYGLIAVAALSYTCLMFVWFALPATLSTVIEDVGLTSTEAGILVGAVPLTYIPLALVSGITVDRLGPGRSLSLGVLCYGFGQIGRSFAPDFPSLLAFTFCIGVGATMITFGLPKLVSTLFPPDRVGFPSALYLIGASAGTASAFAVGQPILSPLLGGWRPLFLWSGVVALCYGVGWFFLARWYRIDEISAEQNDDAFSLASVRRDLRLILSHRKLQFVVVIGTMFLLVNHGLQGWLPTILESRGFSAERGGQFASLFVVAYATGVLSVPVFADRLDARRQALIGCGLGVLVGVSALIAGGVGPLMLAGIVVAGLGVGGLSPLIRAIPPELDGIGARLTGTAVGFIFAVGEIGGFLGPVVVGSFHDVTGSYVPGLGLFALAGIVVCLGGWGLYR
ncbi:CynX/NimT family MFS transporter [Natrialbaceae archaeon A-arb3/5]